MVYVIVTAITMACFLLWFDIEGKRNVKRAMTRLEQQKAAEDR